MCQVIDRLLSDEYYDTGGEFFRREGYYRGIYQMIFSVEL